jgi:hypothetical protein
MASKSKRKRHVAVGYDKEKKAKEEATAPSLPDSSVVKFQDVAVLPEPGDNCGIARMLIPKGSGGVWGGWFTDLSGFHLLCVFWAQEVGW